MSYVGAALSPRETKKLVLGRGSYIGRTYSQVQNRPLYGVASVRTDSAARNPVLARADAGSVDR